MPPRSGAIRQGLDLEWLTEAARHDPLSHAYALWDALRAPERTRFVRWDGPHGARSYLLLWYGRPGAPVVHWIGDHEGDGELVREIPPNARVAIVPERVASAVLRWRRGSVADPLSALRWSGREPPEPGSLGLVRRLDRDDRPELLDFVRRFPDRLTEAYPTLDLAEEYAWGSFQGGRLAGVARAPVRLEALWIIGGIFVAPDARRAGHGRALTLAAVAAARSFGAAPALYVRESNPGAQSLYERLGFRRVARRVWVDLPAPPIAPPTSGSSPSVRPAPPKGRAG